MSEEVWRDQLVALGYTTEVEKWNDAHVETNLTTWEDLLKLLARREARNDGDTARIITGLLALLDVEYEKVNDADGLALDASRRESEAKRQLALTDNAVKRAKLEIESLRTELASLKEISRQTEIAALVGVQIGAFIDAGRKVIKIAELDLPAEWQ